MRRKLTALTASAALLLGTGVFVASPANAAAVNYTLADCSVGSLNGQTFSAAVGDTLTVTFTNCAMFFMSATGTTPPPYASIITVGGNSYLGGNSGGGYILQLSNAAATNQVIYFAASPNPGSPSGSFTVSVTAGGGGGSSSSASAPLETLSLSVAASGATCTGGNPTGYSGSWLTLPSADQCTQSGPTAKAGAKLLGWATSASFPVARAQAQIDKKWGVIDEVIDGQRMIFIPAGMSTFVSGSNNLFPIWSA